MLSAEKHQIAWDAVDELFAGIFHWEDFVGGALKCIADVSNNSIEED